MDRVTSHMNWAQSDNSFESYSVIAVPRSSTTVSIIDSTRVNLTIPYNTPYSVSVVADFCGQRNATMLIKFSYGNSTII